MNCSICQNLIIPDSISKWDKGNNAWPINDGRCCDNCNHLVVMARLKSQEEIEKDIIEWVRKDVANLDDETKEWLKKEKEKEGLPNADDLPK